MSTSTEQTKALEMLEKLGIDPVQLVQEAGLANIVKVQHASFEVLVNDEANKKYGDVTIYKVQSNGYRTPKTGVFSKDLPGLIEQLQAAQEKLA